MDCSHEERLERRRKAFVVAARKLFVEQGFERTTLADVVDLAGGSLATLYKLFGNKAGLLTSVVQERVRSTESLINQIGEAEPEPVAALHRLGAEMRKRMLEPEAVAISRVVIAYSIEDGEFAAEFYRKTLLCSHQALTRVFERWRDKGVPFRGEPSAMASIFLGIFVYELHSAAINHVVLPPGECGEMKDKIDFFCYGAGLLT